MAVDSGTIRDELADANNDNSGTASVTSTNGIEVLEFQLADTRYCAAIDYVEEVVEVRDDELTQVPNAPDHVAGLMDLRGQTTTIIDPKRIYEVDTTADTDLVLVFDAEQLGSAGSMGWLVDAVIKVSQIDPETVDKRMDTTGIKGVVNRNDGFILWVDPTAVSATDR